MVDIDPEEAERILDRQVSTHQHIRSSAKNTISVVFAGSVLVISLTGVLSGSLENTQAMLQNQPNKITSVDPGTISESWGVTEILVSQLITITSVFSLAATALLVAMLGEVVYLSTKIVVKENIIVGRGQRDDENSIVKNNIETENKPLYLTMAIYKNSRQIADEEELLDTAYRRLIASAGIFVYLVITSTSVEQGEFIGLLFYNLLGAVTVLSVGLAGSMNLLRLTDNPVYNRTNDIYVEFWKKGHTPTRFVANITILMIIISSIFIIYLGMFVRQAIV